MLCVLWVLYMLRVSCGLCVCVVYVLYVVCVVCAVYVCKEAGLISDE